MKLTADIHTLLLQNCKICLNSLDSDAEYVIVFLERESQRHTAYPQIIKLLFFNSRSLLRVVGGYFLPEKATDSAEMFQRSPHKYRLL